MGNRLKDIFSDTPENNVNMLNIEFVNAEARRQFLDAVHKVTNDQEREPVHVKGITKINTLIRDADSKYPIDETTTIFGPTIVFPYKEPLWLPVQLEQKEIKLKFERSYTSDSIIIQNDKNSVVYIKIIINKENNNLQVKFTVQPKYAISIEDIVTEYSKAVSFINIYIKNTQNESILKIKRDLQLAINHFNKMKALNALLKINISPKDLTESGHNVEVLYELLVKHTIIKSTNKINFITAEDLPNKTDFKVGNKIQLVFTNTEDYDYFGHKVTVYCAEYVFNIIISKIEKDNSPQYIVHFTDIDSEPMILSRRGYLTESEAYKEFSTMSSRIDSYKNAKTLAELLKLEFESLK